MFLRSLKRPLMQRTFIYHSKKVSSSRFLSTVVADNEFDTKKDLNLKNIPTLKDFLSIKNDKDLDNVDISPTKIPYLDHVQQGEGRKVYFETYGCQMNVNDTEVVWAILLNNGYEKCLDLKEADVIFVMTCAIREGAEKKIWNRLDYFRSLRRFRAKKKGPLTVGILGCMAERLKTSILETDKKVDLVVGPDAYRDLPRLLTIAESGNTAANVQLSLEETYADVTPVRIDENSVTAFVSIMRGCENMCSYCIVPFTRGRERSRDIDSIIKEIEHLSKQGVKEVTLLGQNVNSYLDKSKSKFEELNLKEEYKAKKTENSDGFKTIYRPKTGGRRFADLMERVSKINPEMRIRFTSPHPKDFPDKLLYLIRDQPNICSYIHLPAQSGSTAVLESMRRGYSRESYLNLVEKIRSIIPEVTFSSDFIAGFCGETEDDHQQTLSLMQKVDFDLAFIFAYSLREKTHAHRKLKDDVPENVKMRRLRELMDLYQEGLKKKNSRYVGTKQLVLIEGNSKRSSDQFQGRCDSFIRCVFDKMQLPCKLTGAESVDISIGDYVEVEVIEASQVTLRCIPLAKTSLQQFDREQKEKAKEQYHNDDVNNNNNDDESGLLSVSTGII